MKQHINRNLIAGFSFSLLLLIISSAASLFCISNLVRSSDKVEHTNLVIQKLEDCIAAANNAETNQRGYLLTDNAQFLPTYIASRNKTIALTNEIASLTNDNPVQVAHSTRLKTAITKRMDQLEHVIKVRSTTVTELIPELEKGNMLMAEARKVVDIMKQEETALLARRTGRLETYTYFTPIIIVIAGLMAILITIVFYLRVRSDFAQKNQMEKDLREKDADISRRISIIQKIADSIARGDYSTRAHDEGQDGLGSLSGSLNTMARSLEHSFNLLNDKEWLQTGIAGLNEQMLSAPDPAALAERIITYISKYSNSQTGALYLLGADNQLHITGAYALSIPADRMTIQEGEGLAGQAFRDKSRILVTDVPDTHYNISFANGSVKPASIIAVPIFYEHHAIGVIELSSLDRYSEKTLLLLDNIKHQTGIVINNVQNRTRIQEMLEETQSLAEELQAQHSELENMNTELEAQSQKLQASEEELKVQQEELLQANQELEERAHMLEERNETIAQRNRDIRKKADELALSTKYKSEFLANMSHELRTPLNSILLLSRLMAENNEQNLSPDQVEYAQVIQSSGNGLLSLIDEILDLSKIEAGKMDLEYQDLPVTSISDDMKGLFSPLAREKNLAFTVNLDAAVPARIETDKMRLEQVLKNLLSNALKFTAEGSVSLNIQMAGDQQVRFSVKDTGIGIPAEKHALVFEAFQQADGSTRRKYGGTGLGLSISREIARLFGGELTLVSEAGKGAEFILTIPIGKEAAAEKQNKAAGEIPAMQQPAPTAPVLSNEQRPRFLSETIPAAIPDDRDEVINQDKVVLIVEDDTVLAKSLLNFAHSKGYKGVIAVRGDDALRLAKSYMPSAILLDIQLPVKDGWEVMQELKSDPQTRHIPVHIMSSYAMKKESLQRGAVDYISKPFSFEQMQDVFAKLENALNNEGKKVLIVEENPKHATALSHFLETFRIKSEIASSIEKGMELLQRKEVDCVILDMGIPDKNAYETLETVKQNPSLEDVPIIIFTGESLSKAEEQKIKQYADSIVVKTAHSYKRMLDEVSLFLHLMEENKKPSQHTPNFQKLGVLNNVLEGKTILVADDDVRNIFSLTKSLEQHGVTVVSAIDGREALRRLEEVPDVDLVLMDMMMPEMDGYETTRRIRQSSRTKSLPVIAVTAKTMMGDREKCILAGASDYISKPVDVDQLLSLLRVWLYQKTV